MTNVNQSSDSIKPFYSCYSDELKNVEYLNSYRRAEPWIEKNIAHWLSADKKSQITTMCYGFVCDALIRVAKGDFYQGSPHRAPNIFRIASKEHPATDGIMIADFDGGGVIRPLGNGPGWMAYLPYKTAIDLIGNVVDGQLAKKYEDRGKWKNEWRFTDEFLRLSSCTGMMKEQSNPVYSCLGLSRSLLANVPFIAPMCRVFPGSLLKPRRDTDFVTMLCLGRNWEYGLRAGHTGCHFEMPELYGPLGYFLASDEIGARVWTPTTFEYVGSSREDDEIIYNAAMSIAANEESKIALTSRHEARILEREQQRRAALEREQQRRAASNMPVSNQYQEDPPASKWYSRFWKW